MKLKRDTAHIDRKKRIVDDIKAVAKLIEDFAEVCKAKDGTLETTAILLKQAKDLNYDPWTHEYVKGYEPGGDKTGPGTYKSKRRHNG